MSTTKTSPINIFEVIKDAMGFFKKYYLLVGSYIVLFQLLNYLSLQAFLHNNLTAYWLLMSILFAFQTYIGFGVLIYINSLENGKKIGYQDAFGKVSQRIVPGFITTVIAMGLVILGFGLLVVPGIIALIFLANSTYFVFLENKGPIQSLVLSERLVKGNEWRILALEAVFILPQVAIIMWLQAQFGREAGFLFGIIPGMFATGLYYRLYQALRKANPTVS